MRRTRQCRPQRVALALLAAAHLAGSAGCSVLFDTDEYRHEEQGPVPTAPDVLIAPVAPTTLDDLVALINVESTDPLGEAVSYRYEWDRRDNSGTTGSGLTDATVPAAETVKHETWTVRVIPFVGTREGPAGTASVTVVNSPPVVHFARLSRYEVWQDETLTASAYVTDADGDTTSLSYTWTFDGTAVSGSSAVDLSGHPVGEEISVSVSATDSDRSDAIEPRSAGPATVRAPEGWRQLEPNRGYNVSTPLFFPDIARGRMLYVREGALWEFRVSGAMEIPWAKLNLTGLPDLYGSSVIYDEGRSRFLIWGGVDFTQDPAVTSTALYELVVETPGQETFREIATASAPAARLSHVTLNDGAGSRAVIVGGARPETIPVMFVQLFDDVWELDYSTPDPTFRMVTSDAETPPAVGMGGTVDTQARRGYVFGGFTQSGAALSSIYQYDFDGGSFVEVGALSSARGGIAVSDLGDGTALLVDGGATQIGGTPVQQVERFTYASRAVETVVLSGQRPRETIGTALQRAGDTAYWYPGTFSTDLFVARIRDLESAQLLVAHDVVPGVTFHGALVRGLGAGAGITFAFGITKRDFDRALSGSTYNFDGDRWSVVAALSDSGYARSGASPVVEPRRLPDRVFGSSSTVAFQPDSAVLSNATGTWLEQRGDEPLLHPGLSESPVPAWRCNDRTRVLVNGVTYELDPSGTSLELPDVGSRAPGLRGPAYEALRPAAGTDAVIVFGGDTSGQWWTADPCDANDTWTSQTPTGGPSGRYLATLAKRINFGDDTLTNQIFLFGGATALDNSRTHLDDFWLVTIATDGSRTLSAQQLSSGAGPTPRGRSAAVLGWDTFRSRVLLFGGEGDGGQEFPTGAGGVGRADTWEYRLPMGL